MSLIVVGLMILSFILGKSYGASTAHLFHRMFVADLYKHVNEDAKKELMRVVDEIIRNV